MPFKNSVYIHSDHELKNTKLDTLKVEAEELEKELGRLKKAIRERDDSLGVFYLVGWGGKIHLYAGCSTKYVNNARPIKMNKDQYDQAEKCQKCLGKMLFEVARESSEKWRKYDG